MPQEISPLTTEVPKKSDKNENDEWSRILLALIFLLLSFSCIFCSSQSALWFIDENHVAANMLSNKLADYGVGPLLEVAPVSGAIADEARNDENNLAPKQTRVIAGFEVAALPSIPTLQITPTPVPPLPTLTPTPKPTSPPPPPPTSLPSTAPPLPPPTVVPPTAPPSTPPPTAVPPTPIPVTPPTVPPTTPPTLPPPTSPPDPPTPVPLPSVAFSAVNYNVNEAAGTVTITVTLSAASGQNVTVDYATIDVGSATPGNDYTTTNNTLLFIPGQTSRTFTVPIINDANVELNEIFNVTLSNPTNATLGASNPATVTIIDDDVPTVQFDSATYSVDENAGPAIITVTLSVSSPTAVSVDYATSDGTATAGSDYTAMSGTLNFLPGQTVLTFTVPITDDLLTNELSETVNLTLSNPGNAIIGATNPATLTIINDDVPEVQFSSPNYNAVENQGTATITTTLSAASALTVTVTYSTSNGTAIAGSDYAPISGTLTFNPGVTTRTFTVTIINNAGSEPPPDETVILTLSNPVNATLGVTNPATLTITDDGDGTVCSASTTSVGIGPPDCQWTDLSGGTVITINLPLSGTIPISVDGTLNPDYDLVYYERESPTAGEIALDAITIEVSIDAITWYEVFHWPNAITDTNTNIGQAGYVPPEINDQPIPMSNPPLYGPPGGIISGIAIDVDNPPAGPLPAGDYPWVRLSTGPGAEVDSIQVIPP